MPVIVITADLKPKPKPKTKPQPKPAAEPVKKGSEK